MTRPVDLPASILRGLPLSVLILLHLREQLRLEAARTADENLRQARETEALIEQARRIARGMSEDGNG